MRMIHWAATAFALALTPILATAQAYPRKPVKIVVAFAQGSATDILARLVGEHLSRSLGQPFVVENRAGAGGVIGTEFAAKAVPDGYTLTMAPSGPFGSNPGIYAKLPYDALKDFEPISNIALTPQVFVVGAASRIHGLKDLVAAAKAAPGSIAAGSLGNGATSHLALVYFQGVAGIELNHVPFKGSSEAQTQVIGGNLPMMSDAVPGVRAQVQAGRLSALGVASLKRSPFLPNVPTFAEQGYPGFEAVGWIGLAAPAGTPVAILDALNTELVKMSNDPVAREKFETMGFVWAVGSRQEFAAFIRSEITKWTKVARDAGVKAE